MNGAAVIAEILRREGTEFLSCYPRNSLIEACAALDIRPILCRQERVGVGLADGYTRIKRGKRNGVFAAQAGPGIENAFPGVAQAFSENVPLLMIPAGLPLARQYVRPVFRAADVYRPVTKWSALAHSVQELPDLMRRAYQAMRSGKGGPVLLEVPAEVWEAEFPVELDYAPVAVQRAAPDPDAAREVYVLADLCTGTDSSPGVDHSAFIDVGADIDIGRHEYGILADEGAAASNGIRHHAETAGLEICLGIIGKLAGHLVEILGATAIEQGIVLEAERQQHGLLDPLVRFPFLAVAFAAGHTQTAGIEFFQHREHGVLHLLVGIGWVDVGAILERGLNGGLQFLHGGPLSLKKA